MRTGWVWVAAMLFGWAAMAQPGTDLLRTHLPPTKFEPDLDDMLVRAAEQQRLIVFYVRLVGDPATAAMDARVWHNPTLAAHIRWHSFAYKFDYQADPGLASSLGVTRDIAPAVVVARVKNSRLQVLEVMGTIRSPFKPAPRTSHGPTFGLEVTDGDIPDIYPGTLMVLERTDTELEMLRASDPVWAELHDLKNPEPQPPPESDPLYEVDDEDAVSVGDPEPLSGSPDIAGSIDVYARLDEARDAAANGEVYLATGLYTWLWEKGDTADPSFRAAKRSVVAEEMRELALSRRSARNRFLRLRSSYDERLLWTTYERLGDWFLLNGVVGDEIETVAYLDLFVNDLDEGSMLPECDKIAYRLLIQRGYWNNGYDLGERPAPPPHQLGSDSKFKPVVISATQRAALLVRPDAGGRGVGMDARDRDKISALRRVFPIDECARLHVACLRAGREDDAWRIAETLTGARPGGESRLALVGAAVAAGQVRARHATLLDEAASEGAPHPVLRMRVAAALADAPAAGGTASGAKK